MSESKEKWSVWRAIVYFEDNLKEFKERPVIILDDQTALCLSLKVTSKRKDDRHHVELKQWAAAGLSKPSWVDISKILKIQEDDFRDKVGMLEIEDILAIMRRLKTIK